MHSIKLIPSFTHTEPDGMFYQVEEFKRNVFRIWICYKQKFSYNGGEPVKSVWGFYDYKKCQYFAPVNSKTIGKQVNFKDTRNYTAMQIKQTALEKAFV